MSSERWELVPRFGNEAGAAEEERYALRASGPFVFYVHGGRASWRASWRELGFFTKPAYELRRSGEDDAAWWGTAEEAKLYVEGLLRQLGVDP